MYAPFVFYFFFGLAPLLGGNLYAQPVNNDCRQVFNTRRLICGNSTFTDNSTSIGINDFSPTLFPGNSSGCISTENQSAWYAFTIQTSGVLTFNIIPINPTDNYDFAIWGPNVTCTTLGTPIRCNFSSPSTTGNTTTIGLNASGVSASVGEGGLPFSTPLNVIAGQQYYIMVVHYYAVLKKVVLN